jgi:hypothetical protein
MNSSVIVCDIIFSPMRIIDETSINIVKITDTQQVSGGVAECVTIVGTWFNTLGGFFNFFNF